MAFAFGSHEEKEGMEWNGQSCHLTPSERAVRCEGQLHEIFGAGS